MWAGVDPSRSEVELRNISDMASVRSSRSLSFDSRFRRKKRNPITITISKSSEPPMAEYDAIFDLSRLVVVVEESCGTGTVVTGVGTKSIVSFGTVARGSSAGAVGGASGVSLDELGTSVSGNIGAGFRLLGGRWVVFDAIVRGGAARWLSDTAGGLAPNAALPAVGTAVAIGVGEVLAGEDGSTVAGLGGTGGEVDGGGVSAAGDIVGVNVSSSFKGLATDAKGSVTASAGRRVSPLMEPLDGFSPSHHTVFSQLPNAAIHLALESIVPSPRAPSIISTTTVTQSSHRLRNCEQRAILS
jgi:hypothetical protein